MAAKAHHLLGALMIAGAAMGFTGAATAQGWKPERNVELVLPASPGGSNDIAGRTMQKVWTDMNLLPVSSSVVNRSGGEHNVAYTYVSQRAGDAHTLGLASTPLLVNQIEGRSQLTHGDVTPIAYLITEPMIAVTRTDSPLKTGRDVVEALRKNSGALSIALTSSGHRVSIGMPLLKAGISLKGVRMPAFKGGGETVTAVLGGHADLLVTSVSTSMPHIASGKMRGLAVSSTKRLGGALAQVPTWQELGFNSSGSWKAVIAPKGITPAQIAYWEDIVRKTAQSDELRQYAEKNQWIIDFKGAAEMRKWLDEELAGLKTTMTELGLVKQPQ